MRGFLLGSLALIAVEAAIRNADNAAGAVGFLASVVERFLSPNVAAVPNIAARRTPAAAAAGSATSTTSPVVNPTVAAYVS